MRRFRNLGAAALVVIAAGCALTPSGQLEQPPRLWNHADTYYAIEETFGPYGLAGQAHAVADCESGHDPFAVSPNGYYRGIFQWGGHFLAYRNQIAAEMGRHPSWEDPWIQSVGTLRLVLEQGWRQWQCKP